MMAERLSRLTTARPGRCKRISRPRSSTTSLPILGRRTTSTVHSRTTARLRSPAAAMKARLVAPILISPHDPNTLYYGGERVFKTTDGGVHWEAISPDLTRNDKSKQQASGGTITIDDTGTEYYDTVFATAESPITKGLIWVGTDDGLVHITR